MTVMRNARPMIEKFFQCGFDWMVRAELLFDSRDIPETMRNFKRVFHDCQFSWDLIPSTVSDAELKALESEYRISYPPLYRRFLQTYHYYGLPEIGVRFPKHLPGSWLEELTSSYAAFDPQRIIGIGLLPIGDEVFMDAGLVCLDLRGGSADPPVVFWDHEWIRTKNEVQPMFSSFTRMLRALTFAFEQDLNFVFHLPDDPVEELPAKRLLLKRFLELDPSGAGDSARNYWTTWGVKP